MAIVRLPVIDGVAPGAFRGDSPALGARPADPLLDNFSRRIRYLRVSVTDRCNYRCSYCMPEALGDQLVFEPRAAVLTFEELERLIGLFARLGVRKVRLTGGEPTALGPLVPADRAGDGVPRAVDPRDAGPARYWRVAATGREVGIISAMTEHFCDDCNRLRLTATGALHACLGHDDAISLRDVIRGGGSDDDVVRAISASVTGKRAGHTFERTGAGAPRKHMIGIGG
jgi:molybdenum cofactor biosynthesis enzyme MoaA